MVERLRRLMGRTEIRILVLLVCCILLAGLAVSIAQWTRAAFRFELPTVSSWDELVMEYLQFRDSAFPLVVPDECLPLGQLEAALDRYTLGELERQPGWYWNFDGGTLVFDADSELARQLGECAVIVVYEDMENGEILILRVPEKEGEAYREEIVYRAPEWREAEKGEDLERYLWRELSKRRIAWQVTLKTRKLAEEELAAAELEALSREPEEGEGGVLLRFGEEWTNIWLSVQGPNNGLTNVVIGIHVPDGFTNRVDIFTITNLLSFPWELVATIPMDDTTNSVYWADPLYDEFETCSYTAGNADVDSDGDGLPDAHERFLYGTDPHNWDTDGDGASDGDEIAAGTDPLNNPGDSDGDGLSDDLEIVLGTDPYSADTDGDWVGDGYEMEWGFNPLDPTNKPSLMMSAGDGGTHTRSTNVTIAFPGLVAEHIIIGETADLTNGVLYTFSQQIEYGLQSEINGVRTLYARLYRDTVVQSPLINGSIIFDNVAPTINNLSPTNGASTDKRWIMVSGVATDAYSAVQVFIDGQWADGVSSEGLFQYDRYMLSSGTNAIVITARDMAGNIATQQLDVVQDTSGDTTPPSIALVLPRDFEVNGGVTNWLDQTTFGTNEVLYVQGVTDDETADVRLMVHAEGQTNGPSPAVVVGTQVWGSVQLFPGTNLLEALASDAAGNTATSTWVVIRDTNFFFEITSPVAYQQMNSPSVTVYGVASPAFLAATITVNGVETAITNQGTHVSFATLSPVPLNVGRTEIGALAMLDGRSYYADPQVYGYEVLTMDSILHYRFDLRWSPIYLDECGIVGYDTWVATATYTKAWLAEDRSLIKHDEWEDVYCGVYCNTDCDYWSTATVTHTTSDICPWPVRFGGEEKDFDFIEKAWDWQERVWHSMDCWMDEHWGHDGTLRFIKRWPTQETQMVLFHFDYIDYRRAPGVPFDPSQITYRGQTGFWYNGKTTFLVPLRTEVEHTIKAADFAWPSYVYFTSYPGYPTHTTVEQGRLLQIGQFGNTVLKVQLESDKAMNSPKEFKFDKTTVESPCGKKPENAEALTVYFYQAFNYITRQVQDFDVALKLVPEDLPGVQWTKVSGPASGTLLDDDQAWATFRNPTKGGVYLFDATLDGKTTRSQLWLPTAGPEIGSWLETEIAHLATFAADYLSNAGISQRTFLVGKLWRALDFGPMAAGADWIGTFTSPSSPCGGPPLAGGDAERHTIFGIVVERHKLSNLLVAYAGRAITGWAEDTLMDKFNDYGTPDDVHAIASYLAGFDIFSGTSVQDSIEAHGYDMQAPGWSTREWPSEESPTGGGINRPSAFN
jgi:hypothetical protein